MSVPEKDASCNRVSSLPFPHGKSHAIMNQTSKRKDHAMKKQKLLFVCHGSILRSLEKARYINGFHRSNGAYYTTITPFVEEL